MNKELVIVLDFGGQYNQLVARRVRECNVYCEIYSYKTDLAKIKEMNPKGIILTGGPNSCYEDGAPSYDKALFEMGIPVLGLCYGAQLMMHVLGGTVEKAPVREYGKTDVHVNTNSALFTDVSEDTVCWMSHFDYIFPRWHRDLISVHIRQIVRWQPLKIHQKNCTPFSSIRKCFTPKRERKCFPTLFIMYVIVPVTGAWIHLLSIRLRQSVRKSAMAACSALFPAVSTVRLQPCFFPEPSATSSPASL